MSLFDQLARSLLNTSEKSSRSLFNSSVALSTDIGIVRGENQDRVIFARVKPHGPYGPINLAVVSDGMGGMESGAACATLAVAGLIDALANGPSSGSLSYSLEHAAHAANEAVYREFSGKGGATLSAIAWRANQDALTLNVGDSRIYHQREGSIDELSRLTVDDTMSEAFGGEGKGLIQFIGLGKGLKPHVRIAQRSGVVIATTDGVHFIDPDFFGEVVRNASTPKSKADRMIALARWLGGPDNASIAVIDLDKFPHQSSVNDAQVEIWPCGAEQTCIWMAPQPPRPTPQREAHTEKDQPTKVPSKSVRKRKSASKKAKEEAQGRLQIEVDVVEDNDADS